MWRGGCMRRSDVCGGEGGRGEVTYVEGRVGGKGA